MVFPIYNFKNWLPFIAEVETATFELYFSDKVGFLRRHLSSDVAEYLGHRLYPWNTRRGARRRDIEAWGAFITILTRRLRGRDTSIKGDACDVSSWIESFRNNEISSAELWTVLHIQKLRGVTMWFGMREFWEAHSVEGQQRLEELSPLFNPDHESRKGYIKDRLKWLDKVHRLEETSLQFNTDEFSIWSLEFDICEKTFSSETSITVNTEDNHDSGSLEIPQCPDTTLEASDELSEAELTNASEELALPAADWTVIN